MVGVLNVSKGTVTIARASDQLGGLPCAWSDEAADPQLLGCLSGSQLQAVGWPRLDLQ